MPLFFFGKIKLLSPIVGALSKILFKKSVLGLLNPVTSVKNKHLSSQRTRVEIIGVVTGGGALSNADHLLIFSKERRDGQEKLDDANDATLKGLVGDLIGTNRRVILRAKNTGAWLNICGTPLTGTLFLDM